MPDGLVPALSRDFIGVDRPRVTVDGATRARVYLDSAATTLMWMPVWRCAEQFLEHYANTHSRAYQSARTSADVVAWSRRVVLQLLAADPGQYACFFVGSGSTGGLNRMARLLSQVSPGRVALVSVMEHHSNDLPHRQYRPIAHVPVEPGGRVSVAGLRRALEERNGQVAYLAVSAVSNVTGIINPIGEFAAIAHEYGVPIVVDGSQAAAHVAHRFAEWPSKAQPDAFVFSGHKLYAPGAPGAVVIKRALLGQLADIGEIGGGVVNDVYQDDYELVPDVVARQEAGTPNIVGILMLGAAAWLLQQMGLEQIERHERALLSLLLDELHSIDGVRIYGSGDLEACPRAGSLAFNIRGLPHGLTAAILDDYFAIEVRNACFCAHPYVRALLREEFVEMPIGADARDLETVVATMRGMVRISLGLYSRGDDVLAVTEAVKAMARAPERYAQRYRRDGDAFVLRRRGRTGAQFDAEAVLRASGCDRNEREGLGW